ncbi:MAG: YhcB family protein [Wenzhouxiangella sp.]
MWEGIIGLVAGLAIGATVAVILHKRRDGSTESVASLKRENERFREEVNEHFVQTAELINQLTDSYKAVFDHLSDGAERLVEPEVVRERMPQVSGEEVRLKRIGSTAPADSPEQPKKSDSAPESIREEAPETEASEESDASAPAESDKRD